MQAVLFDTETTGLIRNHSLPLNKQPHVFEIAAIRIEIDKEGNHRECGRYQTLLEPPVKLIDKIVEITSVTNEMLVGEKKFAEVADEFALFVDGADAIVAHNLAFDMGMIDFEYRRLGRQFEWPARKTCTVEQTMHLKGHRLNLSKLHMLLLGEPFEGAHRAMVDVEALTRCYLKLLEMEQI